MLQKEVINVRLTSSLAHEDDFSSFKKPHKPCKEENIIKKKRKIGVRSYTPIVYEEIF